MIKQSVLISNNIVCKRSSNSCGNVVQGKTRSKCNIPVVITDCARDTQITKIVCTEEEECKLENLFEIN